MKIAQFILIVVCSMFLSGFGNKVTEEDYRIIYSHKDSQSSFNSKKDEAYGSLSLHTTIIEKTGKRSFARKGPYNIFIGAVIDRDVRAIKPVKIILEKVKVTITNRDSRVHDLIIRKDDWKVSSQEYKSGKNRRYRLQVSQYLKNIEIDFDRLREVILYIEFKGVYEDETVKSYWSKKIALPNYTKEKYNQLIQNLMSV